MLSLKLSSVAVRVTKPGHRRRRQPGALAKELLKGHALVPLKQEPLILPDPNGQRVGRA